MWGSGSARLDSRSGFDLICFGSLWLLVFTVASWGVCFLVVFFRCWGEWDSMLSLVFDSLGFQVSGRGCGCLSVGGFIGVSGNVIVKL